MSDLNVRLKITTDTQQAEKSLMTATQRTKAWQQATDSLSQSSSLATQALQQNTQALDKNGNRIHAADAALGRFVDTQGKMREANGRFVKGLSETDKALGKVGKSAKRAAISLNYFKTTAKGAFNTAYRSALITTAAVGGLRGAMVALSTVAIGSLALLATDAAHTNKELNNLSISLNINRDTLQSWQLAAGSVGISGQKISDIFKDINDKLGDFASTGGGEGKDIFERLKVDINELIQLSPDQALLRIYDAMEKVDDISQQEKTFLLESLANDASLLTPLLQDNAQKLREIDELSSRSGAVLSDDQVEILNEANAKTHELGIAFKGLSNEVGTLYGRFINTFGDDIQSAIIRFKDHLATIPEDIKAQSSAWQYTLAGAEDELAEFQSFAEKVWDHYYEKTRIVSTYIPVYARAAYDSAGSIITAWQAETNATYERYKQSVLTAMMVTVASSKGAAVTISSIWGAAIGWIIDRFADLVSGAISMLEPINALADFAGFDPITIGADNAVAGIRALANESRNSGQVVAGAFDGVLDGLRNAKMESEAAEAGYLSIADAARETANAAFEAADAFVEETETQRELNLEFAKAERQIDALEGNLNKTTAATKKFRVNQEEVDKALGKGEKKTKKLTKAKKEAKTAAEKLADAQKKEIESLQDAHRKLILNEQAYYAASLKAKGFKDSVIELASGLNYQNTLLEEQQKLTAETVGLSPNVTAKLSFDLDKRGLNQSDIAQLVGQKLGIEQQKFIADLNEQVAELSLSEEAFKRSTWAAQGFSESQIEARLALESKIRGLEKHKEQLEENKKKLEAIEEAYSSEKAALLASKIELEQGSDALYRHELKLKGVSKVRQDELLALRQQNEAYEQQQQYLDKVSEKLASLKLERSKIGQNTKAAFELDLKAEGFKPDDIATLTQEKMTSEFEKVKQSLQEQRQQLTLTAKDYRNLGLEMEGFDAKQRAFITGFEAQNERMKSWQDIANQAFDAVGQNLTQVALTGKADWKSMIDELIKATFELTIIQPFIESLKASFASTSYSGGGVGGFFSSLIGGLFADGGAFVGGQQVSAFANGGAFTNAVVSQPTPFSFNGGKLGVMGEAGAEAVMPLHRDAGGSLGVKADIVAKAPPVFINMPPSPAVSSPQAQAPRINVNIKNIGGAQSNAHVENVQQNQGGGFDIDVVVSTVERKIVQGIRNNSSPLGRTLDGRFVKVAK